MNPSPKDGAASPIQNCLAALHAKYAALHDGNVATYIPELAKADPNWFGICLVTATGTVYEVGDTRQPFTIQSISKPFVYGLALEDHGREHVLTKIGVEPTGDAFNSISLDPGTGRPRNPMINAGAIAAAGLIAGETLAVRRQRLLDMFSRFTGRELAVDEPVYRSESETGFRNRAIGYMLRNFNILADDPMAAAELYFMQCSIAVTCRDLAVMAATLANRGVNPVTSKRAIRREYVPSLLSVMGSCGMYDYAGEWIYKIGMPAKSGVAGGIIAVLPGQLGIGVFSPRLDPRGNSVRGIRVCEDLSRDLELHLFDSPSAGKSVIRRKFTGVDFKSNRVRTPPEREQLSELGRRLKAYQLQGTLGFANIEVIIRDIMERVTEIDCLVLDFKQVLSMTDSACRLLAELFTRLFEQKTSVAVVHAGHLASLQHLVWTGLERHVAGQFRAFEDKDLAMEWCENRLLAAGSVPVADAANLVLQSHYELFKGLSPAELAVVEARLQRRTYPRGAVIIQVGSDARELFFLARGGVSVLVPLASGESKRVATLCPGMAFGEMALLDGAPRSATVLANTASECDVLSLDDFDQLTGANPQIKIVVLKNLCLGFSGKLREANRHLSVFD
ncbi:MAG: glutaminase A [Verrucomicrobiota bacterium]